ncbi:unnamed protein product [Rotaria sp. Silwood1]|nr:unnamed protein product [Rotaria sp. Silwood1]CAF3535107.1 unnamed protein product [Rotaria sp. Silwood1]
MLKKYSSWASCQSSPSMNTDMTMIKSVTVKSNEQQHQQESFEKLVDIQASSNMHVNDDIQSSSIRLKTRAIQLAMISKQRASFFAAPIKISSSITNEQNKVCSIEKLSKDTPSTIKRNSKHKHKHHHHHHHHRHHQHRRQRAKYFGQKPKILSPSKFSIKNPKHIDQDQQNQQPKIIYPRVSTNKDDTINMNGLTKTFHNTNTVTELIDDQKTPSVVYHDADIQPSSLSKSISQSVVRNKDQEKKTTRGNIPLKTIENKFISQRVAGANEAQVGNYCTTICAQSTPSCINPCCVEQAEQICIEDNCCIPSTTINCGSNSCVIQQCDPIMCVPQQQQQQIVICADSMPSQNFCCTSSSNNIIQQTQQYFCADNNPQLSMCQSLSTNSSPQSLICVSQTPCQATPSIVIQQQPQIQVQPLQIISSSQTPAAQCVQLCSSASQVIPSPTIQITPQILYQRPYDTVVLPVQNQQLVCATPPAVSLSRPSYAPMCVVPAASAPPPSGPNMFRNALIQIVSKTTGIPVKPPMVCTPASPAMVCSPTPPSMVCSAAPPTMVCSPTPSAMVCSPAPPAMVCARAPQAMVCAPAQSPMVCTPAQSPMVCAPAQPTMVCTPSPLLTDGSPGSASPPIVPLTPGGLLIPFEPSEPSRGMIRGALSRSNRYPSNLKTFDDIRQQMLQRAQVLSELRRMQADQLASSAQRSRNMPVRSLPGFSSNLPRSTAYQSGLSRPFPSFSSNLPSQPPMYRSQTPYPSGNLVSPSSSSSRSSASSTAPNRPPGQSVLSGPSTAYQSFQP